MPRSGLVKDPLFHSRMIRPVVGGGGRTYLKQTLRLVAGNRFIVKHG